MEQSETALDSLSATNTVGRLPDALRLLIAAVKRQTNAVAGETEANLSATELLARSYYEQSRALRDTSLNRALSLARYAVAVNSRSTRSGRD